MNSGMYEGYVEHRRFVPAEHHFRYRLYFYCFDLDELEELDRRLPLFGYNRFRPASLYDRDYLGRDEGSIREKILSLLSGESIDDEVGRILLITSARYLNYIFNPVSFYYCFSPQGRLLSIVAEVNNTFGEKHIYVLKSPEEPLAGYIGHYRAGKAFHVSPFNSVAGDYEFLFSAPGDEIDICINLHREKEQVFEARLRGTFRVLTPTGHAAMMLKYPVVPHLAMPRIFLQAGRLFFQKKLSYLDKPFPLSPMTIRRSPPGPLQKLCMRLVRGILNKTETGGLTLFLPDRQVERFGQAHSGPQGDIRVNDYRFFSRLVTGGDVGLGEAYVEGFWDTKDIPELFRFFIRNRDVFRDGYPATAWLKRRKNDLLHLCRINTLRGSKRNIQSHYDLGNDFFSLFLDSSMTYSSGIYRTGTESIEEAQLNKHGHIIEKAKIGKEDHLLEIGCGWGGFALEAARRTGCRVTGITISREQGRFARERVEREKYSERVAILMDDYRTVSGRYDAIICIEMLEAVGERYFGAFFEHCDRLLKPGGLLLVQVITVPDSRYREYRKETDWIQKHIFPGGMLPSTAILGEAAGKHSNLVMEDTEDIGPHYAWTLRHWRERFIASGETVRAMGFDRSFQRKWIYYLATCEAGFAEGALQNMQILFRKPFREETAVSPERAT